MGKDRKKYPQSPEARPKGQLVSRRRFLQGLIVAFTARKPAEIVADAAVDAAINATYPIPQHLQHPAEIPEGEVRTAVGLGNSIMQGVNAQDTPLVNRVAQEVQEKGIGLHPISGAEKGSTATDLPRQYRSVKGRIPKGAKQEIHVLTGQNDVLQDHAALEVIEAFRQQPWNPLYWIAYFRVRGELRRRVGKSIHDNISTVLQESGARHVVVYGSPPEQYSPEIDVVGPKGTQKTSIRRDRSPTGTVKRIIVADLSRQATGAAADAAKNLRQDGVDVRVVDAAEGVTPHDFPLDQHPNAQGAQKIAQNAAKLYKKGEKRK